MIFKKFFSRTVIAAFIVLIEVGFIAFAATFFSKGILTARIIGTVIAIITALYIINKPQIPELKIPWLIGLAILPIFATITYIFLGNAHFNRREQSSIEKILSATKAYTDTGEKEIAAVKDYLGDYAGIFNYLYSQNVPYARLYNKTDFLSTGESFYTSLLSDLENAEKFIFMEYFIIEEGEMWNSVLEILKRKADSGVKVKIIYDDIGCAGKLKHAYSKKLAAYKIECKRFNVITLRPSGVFNNRDHRKITVIDGKIGYMGGINLADEYINVKQPFGHFKDSAIRIKGSAVKTLTSLFLATFYYRNKEHTDYDEFFNVSFPESEEKGCIMPFGCGPLAPYDEQMGRNVFLSLINSAKKSVYITTPYLIVDQSITNAIIAASRRGVDVRIITPHIPDKKIVFAMTRSSYPALIKAGVKIYEYSLGFIHAKQVITDDKLAFVGTLNLDYRSLAHHFECGAIIYDSPALKDIKADFEEIFKVSEEKTIESSKQNTVVRLILLVFSLLRPLF